MSAVCVSLNDLKADLVPFETLEEAFGPSSLGVIIIKDLPPEFTTLRHALLSYSSYLANLPEEELARLESPTAKWLVGWSCGKETLKDGRYDTLKGSYYVNCAPQFEDPSLQAKLSQSYPSFPEYTAPNIWPGQNILPGFETTFRELCTLITDTAVIVARACDRYAEAKIEGYTPGTLERIVRTSVSTKARLLHYFPSSAVNGSASEEKAASARPNDQEDDDWCATHVDHGCLTGLTSAMFVDETAHSPQGPFSSGPPPALPELPVPPDPRAGLYIYARSGSVVKVSIPRDCLAFQTGEALEVIARGRFKAVPHFVRGISAPTDGGVIGKVARNTLAVFTQPNLWEKIDAERDFATFAREIVERNH